MTVKATEFLRRFFLHVLPKGFVRTRSFGFLSNRPIQTSPEQFHYDPSEPLRLPQKTVQTKPANRVASERIVLSAPFSDRSSSSNTMDPATLFVTRCR